MSTDPERNDRDLDERLAEYTDRLLSGEQPEHDAGLSGYVHTVQVLKGAFSDGPGKKAADRLGSELRREWRRLGLDRPQKLSAGKKNPWWLPQWPGWGSYRSRRQALSYGFVTVLALVVIASFFISPLAESGALPGAADGDLWTGGLIAMCVLLGGVVSWLIFRRKL